MATLLPNGEQTFFDDNGLPLAAGKVYFYVPGTTVPKDTYEDPDATILNTNPVILDAAGRAIIYGRGAYRQIVKDSLDNIIWDQLTADTSSAGGFEWAETSSGTANAQTVVAPAFTAQDGQGIAFIAGLTNTGTTTLNPSGTGAVQIVRDTVSGPLPLTGGEITEGNLIEVVYDETAGFFHLVSYPTTAAFQTIASAATTDIGSLGTPNVNVTGTGTTISSFGSSASLNFPMFTVVFAGDVTLTDSASLSLPGSADITTAAGDSLTAQYLGSANWRVLAYHYAGQAPNGLLQQGQVAPGTATLDLELPSSYPLFTLSLYNFAPATNAALLAVQISTDDGATYEAGLTDYVWMWSARCSDSSDGSLGATGAYIAATGSMTNVLQTPSLVQLAINPGKTGSCKPAFNIASTYTRDDLLQISLSGGGAYVTSATRITNIRLKMSSGNFALGEYALYGVQ